MNSRKHRIWTVVGVLCVAAAACGVSVTARASTPALTFTPFHADGIYALGETVGWTVTLPPGEVAPKGSFSYTIQSNHLDVVKTGSFTLSSGSATIAMPFDEPAMLYVTVDYQPSVSALSRSDYREVNQALEALLVKSNPALKSVFARYPHYQPIAPQFPLAAYEEHRVATLGAAVAPTRLRPSIPAPADFWSFWQRQLARLARVPMSPVLTPMPTAQPGVKLYRVRLDSVGSHVHGYLAVPAKGTRFPALILYQWAGVYPLDPAWATNRAAEGWLTLDVDSHDLPPSVGTGVSTDYQAIGDRNPNTSYFLDMYLRDTRALQYIRHDPRWNGKTVVFLGTSMGGQQSLVTAGLNPGKVTAVLVDEPSGTDMNGLAHGRNPGYPYYDITDPKVLGTAAYFDPVNFAPHITASMLVAMGFIDTTACPAGIWTALNAMRAPKEAVPMIESDHNNITPDKQDAWLKRSEEVLATLVHGGRFVPNEALTRPESAEE